MKNSVARTLVRFLVVAGVLIQASTVCAQTKDLSVRRDEVTILVTVIPHNDRTRADAEKLSPTDFAVSENKIPQKVISAAKAAEEPVILAVLIQDDLVGRVNNELDGIREFIRGLPKGSRVMTGYLTSGTIQVTQEFTPDRDAATKSLRILLSTATAAPYNPYVEVIEAAKRFADEPEGRRMILMVSDGLDISNGFRNASPSMSTDLDRAIKESQRRQIAVFTFYAPSVGLTSFSRMAVNFGQGSLNRIAEETGGEAFFSGTDFVSFAPYFREYNGLLENQWLITYRSDNTGKKFRRIEVTTDFDIHLLHPAGYSIK